MSRWEVRTEKRQHLPSRAGNGMSQTPEKVLPNLRRKSLVGRVRRVCAWRGPHCRMTPRATLSPGGEVAGSVCRSRTSLRTVPGVERNPYQRARAGAVDSIIPAADFHISPPFSLTGAVRCVRTQLCLGTAAILPPRSHLVQFPSVCTTSTGVSSRSRCHRLYPRNV